MGDFLWGWVVRASARHNRLDCFVALAMTMVLNCLALYLLCHCEPRQWRGNPDNKEQTTIRWIASLRSQWQRGWSTREIKHPCHCEQGGTPPRGNPV